MNEKSKKNHSPCNFCKSITRVLDEEHIGNWNLLLGNIPRFIEKYNIDINWDIMYRILKWFLKESLICDLDA